MANNYEELVRLLRNNHHPNGLKAQAADAIEELQQIASHYEETAKDYFKDVCYYLERVPKWIPVTERLPDENDDVLIYGEWTGASGTKYREIWLTDLKGFLHQGYKPIAWMPIPEPPCEERKDPCADCVHYPPSSMDGKPCCACDPANPLTNCHEAKEET